MNAAGYESGSVYKALIAGREQGNRNREAAQMERGREYGLNQMGRVDQNAAINQADGTIYDRFRTNTPEGNAVFTPHQPEPFLAKLKNFFTGGSGGPAPQAAPRGAIPSSAQGVPAPQPMAGQPMAGQPMAGQPMAEQPMAPEPPAGLEATPPEEAQEAEDPLVATPSPRAIPVGQVNLPEQELAEGGPVYGPQIPDATKEEQARMVRDAAEARARNPGAVSQASEDAKKTLGSRTKERFTRVATNPGVRKVIGEGKNIGSLKGMATGAVAANMIGSAVDTGFTDTRDIAHDLGIPQSQVGQEGLPGLGKDVAIRTIGQAVQIGRNLLPDALTPDGFGPRPTAKKPARVAPDAGRSTSGPPRRSGLSRDPAAAPAGPARQAVPSEPKGPPEDETIDMTQFHPQEVPNMGTTDWEAYRASAMREQRRLGTNGLQALKEVDDTITAMQQKGFAKYAQQGMALQTAGNLQGAMSAYRAAYQYFPTGYDVRLGLYKGKIVGLGIDEATGKPAGTPRLVNEESIGAMLNNLSDPAAWNHWAKDRRDFELGLRKFDVDKASAENTMRYQTTLGQEAQNRTGIDQQNADTLQDRFALGAPTAAGAAAAATDLRATQQAARKELEMLSISNPELSRFLRQEIALAQKAMPQVPADAIIYMVMRKYKEKMSQRQGQQ